MNATDPSRPSAAPPEARYVLASDHEIHIAWLSRALAPLGRVIAVPAHAASLDESIARHQPRAVFLDFGDARAGQWDETVAALRREWPVLPLIGAGTTGQPGTVVAALRAGVDEFVDLSGSELDVTATVQRLQARRTEPGQAGPGLVLLGARAGLGTTTLAVHLTVALQEMLGRLPAEAGTRPRGATLLDLGVPERDSLLYLNLQSNFSFVDGVHNLRRLDRTLLQTALTWHPSGAGVLPLPANLSEIRQISHSDSAALMQRFNDFFAYQIVDLGGCNIPEFISQTARAARKVWVVCDQGIGAIVSTAAMLKRLRGRGVDTTTFGLVVNRFEKTAGLDARDIAERLGVPLAFVLPARGIALAAAASRGELLLQRPRHDPYGHTVHEMARALWPDAAQGVPAAPPDGDWKSVMGQILGRLKT